MRFLLPILLLVSILRGEIPQGESLLPDPFNAYRFTAGSAQATCETIDIDHPEFNKAWSIAIPAKAPSEFDVQLVAPVDAKLEQGDVILFSAWARMLTSADESNEGRVGFVLEQSKDPHAKVFSQSFGLSNQWQRIDIPAKIDRDFSTIPPHLTIRLSYYQQSLQIAGIRFVKLPRDTDLNSLPHTRTSYAGREPEAKWRKEALARIEEIRKSDLTVRVLDAKGAPVPNATVEIKMLKQSFPFGSCYNVKHIPSATDPDSQKYREIFKEFFNIGVDEYAMKWSGWIDPATRAKALAALDWMTQNGIAVRGHTLVWPSWKRMPSIAKELEQSPEQLRQLVAEHITEEVTALKGKVIDWDVVNEPFVNNDLLKIFGEGIMADWFKLAHQSDPNAKLYLNETSVPTSSPNDIRYTTLYDRAKAIQDAGAPIHGVGMQAHFGMTVQPPRTLLGIYDRFAQLGIPVRITELDIDTPDEDLQADYFRDFLIASYSHRNIDGILIWGFWEGQHWKPKAAMFKKDWSERKIAQVWRDLVLKDWRTNTTVTTNDKGEATVRAFHGEYQISTPASSSTVTVHAQPILLQLRP